MTRPSVFIVYRPADKPSTAKRQAFLELAVDALESADFDGHYMVFDDRDVCDDTKVEIDATSFTNVGLQLFTQFVRASENCMQVHFVITSREDVDDLALLMLGRCINKFQIAWVHVRKGVDLTGTPFPALATSIDEWEVLEDVIHRYEGYRHALLSQLAESLSPHTKEG